MCVCQMFKLLAVCVCSRRRQEGLVLCGNCCCIFCRWVWCCWCCHRLLHTAPSSCFSLFVNCFCVVRMFPNSFSCQALNLNGTKLRGRPLRVTPCGKRTKGRGGKARQGTSVRWWCVYVYYFWSSNRCNNPKYYDNKYYFFITIKYVRKGAHFFLAYPFV